MTTTNTTNRQELLNEIADCTAAIKAFKAGFRHLAPSDLIDAPSIEWLEMQQRACRRQLAK
jgi:hypothetical protein